MEELLDKLEKLQLKPLQVGKRTRGSFAKITEELSVPDLIEVQKKSYEDFFKTGLMEVLEDASPITDYSGRINLYFSGFTLDKSHCKYGDVETCKERDANYAAPLYFQVRLQTSAAHNINVQAENDDGANNPEAVTDTILDESPLTEQNIYICDFPLMTEHGTFVINGAERVVVSQLVRSPGIYYSKEMDKTGVPLFSAQMIPNRGAWIEYETDVNGAAYARIDRTRKLPVTVLLRALGLETNEEIEQLFGSSEALTNTLKKDDIEQHRDDSAARAAEGSDEGIAAPAASRFTPKQRALLEIHAKLRPGEIPSIESAQKQFEQLLFDSKRYDLAHVGRYKYNKKMSIANRITGRIAVEDIIHPYTGEILVEAGKAISEETAWQIQDSGCNVTEVISANGEQVRVIGNNFVHIKPFLEGYNIELASALDENTLADEDMVHLPTLLRICEDAKDDDPEEFNRKLCETAKDLAPKHVLVDDIIASVSYLFGLYDDLGVIDDIDHLGNRRLRSVGELLQNQVRMGLARMERVVKERMAVQDLSAKVSPNSIINVRPVSSAVKEFFGSSQLSQFMDQPNPLAELTHKRRTSALGPGGLNRERASFAVRDVHYSHYSRICPIETPEGPNIGLIGSLATYAKVNRYGFIEAPYRKVDKETGIVTKEIRYMPADEEDRYIIAQATEPLDENGRFIRDRVTVRRRADIIEVNKDQVDYVDVSPRQLISVATGMIPFLENDDANRALMGSKMQRQAVPLLIPEAPLVGTGIEYKAACDSGVVLLARQDGVVASVSADRIVIRDKDGVNNSYKLQKFTRSNQGTCINQHPIVSEGEEVTVGQVIADGPSTDGGEISLGKNALIGFMTWEGYNYEDAVLLSERLVKEDMYTSIHIEEFECEARETKLGAEEITREIPNVSDEALHDLGSNGIIRIGAEVRANDILVGKVTPKGETELSAEERLMRAIFGEKVKEVRDTSLRVPNGEFGIVVDIKEFKRENHDELQPGVNQIIRVYIAQKRKIQVGDKMAGRHGNKGVVSRVLPEEDMPFLADGTPLDIVLNPLGVPSRMNIGQVLEVHLGLAAKALGIHVATPVFDGANEEGITQLLEEAAAQATEKARLDAINGNHKEEPLFDEKGKPAIQFSKLGLSHTGKLDVYDGRTGDKFEHQVTVGYMYYLKLHHLVDDKIHARSTGPYSLVTQQPLGGKAQFGGQRFGEMEVWALEAYGASHVLQEILTVKSDDTTGRVKTYEAIVKGKNIPDPGLPESFKVLIKELQSIALDIRVLDRDKNEIVIHELEEEDEEPIKIDSDRKEIEEAAALFVDGDDESTDDEDEINGSDDIKIDDNPYDFTGLDEEFKIDDDLYDI